MLRAILLTLIGGTLVFAQPGYEKRLNSTAEVLESVMESPDQGIPQGLLNKAACVVVFPSLKKGAFIFGGKYGRGYATCRNDDGVGWTAPGAVRMEGFNFGLQAGGQETELVLLVMNERGMQRLLTSQFTLGGDASVAAGPVGRTVTANTDALLTAEILSWSRSRGLFAGISLDGATLRQDRGVNGKLYGAPYRNRDILDGKLPTPAAAEPMLSVLNRYSSRDGSAVARR